MRILIATDAWRPQVNGVVRSLEYLASEAPSLGAEICFLTPDDFRTVPLPGYRSIRLALAAPEAVRRRIAAARPDFGSTVGSGPAAYSMPACGRIKEPFMCSIRLVPKRYGCFRDIWDLW